MGVCKYQSTVSLVKLAGAIGRTVYILSAKNTVYVWVIRPLYIIDIYIYRYHIQPFNGKFVREGAEGELR